jgi:predicted peptidase
MEDLVFDVLERSIEEYVGDTKRIYLTGLSMGGYGTFYFGSKYPDKFAALVPVCGGVLLPRESRQYHSRENNSPYMETARKIGSKPIWIFHGGADPVVPPAESRRMKEAFESLGIIVRYTEYPEVGHNSWENAYSEPELLDWMLSQKLK